MVERYERWWFSGEGRGIARYIGKNKVEARRKVTAPEWRIKWGRPSQRGREGSTAVASATRTRDDCTVRTSQYAEFLCGIIVRNY